MSLSPGEAEAVLAEGGIEPARRPADLGLEEWARLYMAYRRRAAAASK